MMYHMTGKSIDFVDILIFLEHILLLSDLENNLK